MEPTTFASLNAIVTGLLKLVRLVREQPKGVTVSVLILGMLMVGGVHLWNETRHPPEFVVKGIVRYLRGAETLTAEDLFLRVNRSAGNYFRYEWRHISSTRYQGPVKLWLQKPSGAQSYELMIRPDYYTGDDLEITYNRGDETMIVAHNGHVETIQPKLEGEPSAGLLPSQQPSVVHAQDNSGSASIADLIASLEASSPVVRDRARTELKTYGTSALPELEKAVNRGSPQLRIGVLNALLVMSRAQISVSASLRCAISKLAAVDTDKLVRAEARRLIENNLGADRGCNIPSAIDELKIPATPVALASHPDSGLFLLDQNGRVYRLDREKKAPALLFSIPTSTQAVDLAAGPSAVAVIGNNANVGQLFVFTLSSGRLTTVSLPVRRFSRGVAMDADTLYVGTSGDGYGEVETRSLDGRGKRPLDTHPLKSIGAMILDETEQRLIISDPESSSVSILPVAKGKIESTSRGVGAVTAVATSSRHYLLASGGKILFRSRVSGAGENPPPGIEAMKFQRISGLAVDESGDLWVADAVRNVIKGPIVLR